MLSELSDDDFCETNFSVPSPVKKCSLLPSAKERNTLEMRKKELRQRVFITEKECFDVIGNSLKVKEEESVADKKDSVEFVLLTPQGRKFFETPEIHKGNLKPSLWFENNSQFHDITLEEFFFHLIQDKSLNEEEEDSKLTEFCLNILLQETDPVLISHLVCFLSKQVIAFDMIEFNKWGGPSLSSLIYLISKSVSGYNAAEAEQLFRQACFAALDSKTFALSTELRELISECLAVFETQFKVSDEINWLMSLDLRPEEGFRLLEVLPGSGLYGGLNLYFAWKFLPTILSLNCCHLDDQAISWQNLTKFLEENELKIRNLTPNFYFCFMNILKFIAVRITEDGNSCAEMVLNIVDRLKLHFCQDKGNVSYYLSMEAFNRLYFVCNERCKSKKHV